MLLLIKKRFIYFEKNILKNDEAYAKNRLKALYKKNSKIFVPYFFTAKTFSFSKL
jgi:hypothetical protein